GIERCVSVGCVYSMKYAFTKGLADTLIGFLNTRKLTGFFNSWAMFVATRHSINAKCSTICLGDQPPCDGVPLNSSSVKPSINCKMRLRTLMFSPKTT